MSVPSDFPREPVLASLAGLQPKVGVRFDANTGRYVAGQTDTEVAERYEICEDLVVQLVAKCQKNRTTKYVNLTETQILERLQAQLLGTNWGSPLEMQWVIRQTASALGWVILESAAVLKGT